jgi:hypothetical protein
LSIAQRRVQTLREGHQMTNLLRDFRFAFRLLWQNKSFTAVAVLALALWRGRIPPSSV